MGLLTLADCPKALLFDMDGTLVDNIPFHQQAWLLFLKEHHLDLKPDEFHAQNHGTISEMMRRFFPHVVSESVLYDLGQGKEKSYRELYLPHIKEVKGLTPLLKKLSGLGIQAHLATMGDQPNIDFVLDSLGIRSFFRSTTGSEEVRFGKPAPDIFLKSLQKASFPPSACWIIEDSKGGIVAGKAAGCHVVGITTSHEAEELLGFGADRTIGDFEELAGWFPS